MSNLDSQPIEVTCTAGPAEGAAQDLLVGREVVLGTRGMAVTRTLPHRDRRMVGAWCFVDHFGPHRIAGTPGMRVAPHPHTGLQTVSWLVEGDVLHRDSIGSEQMIRPGQLNLMTAGLGIAHSEESPTGAPPVLHGVQLWVALPGHHRDVPATFEHHADLPRLTSDNAIVTVIMGELGELRSPATTYSPLLAAQVALTGPGEIRLPLRPGFEHAVLVLDGAAEVDGIALAAGPLLYLGSDRAELTLRAEQGAAVLLLGGEPFEEEIVMWWNFVGRSHEDIVEAREAWTQGRGFGTVHGYDGAPLPAPPMPTTRLKPRGRHR